MAIILSAYINIFRNKSKVIFCILHKKHMKYYPIQLLRTLFFCFFIICSKADISSYAFILIGAIMMKRTSFAIIGGDARFITLTKLLADDGHAVFPAGHGEEFSAIEGASAANAIILPLPCSVDGDNINAPLSDAPIPFDDNLIKAIGSKPIFAGMFTRLRKAGTERFNIFDYGKREDFLLRNAQSTAEGALAVLIEASPHSLFSMKGLITGFGRIGSALLRILISCGAEITVAARNPAQLALAQCCGADTLNISEIDKHASDFDFIINTVPHPVIGINFINAMKNEAVMIDLASGDGGMDFEAAAARGITATHALSLPGKFSPCGAALDIKKTIYSILEEVYEIDKY